MSVIICRPRTVTLRTVAHCSTCDRRRRFVGSYEAWYGVTWTCLGCGDSWNEGQRLPRPFARGWRKESIRHARAMWDAALPRRDANRLIRKMIEDACA